MTEEKPRPSLDEALAKVRLVAGAQGSMGWMVRGDLAKARETLEKLSAEQLREVSAAAAALSSLADEVAGGKS
ncbi:hypothetical protein [Saccharothrix xinjiangensis]|uniref:ANTAR domain-containing protein n=1 Tax=Saccharothrix xinjiangensis TaxID=204798 RepID=A0ABV9XTB0_9PSEU